MKITGSRTAATKMKDHIDLDLLRREMRKRPRKKTDFLFICLFRLKYTVERPA